MDFVKGNVRSLFFRYLFASLGSAVVMSIYSFVDTIAVGQSVGSMGTAAMAVITPLYGITAFLGILCGVGGSSLLTERKAEGDERKGNSYFVSSLILMTFFIVSTWVVLFLFHESIFTFFGADEELMPYVWEYGKWVVWFWPAFILPIYLSAFVRNDSDPSLATSAVVIGGVANIFLDWFLCFPMGMGMAGAGIASTIGTCVQLLIMLIHFIGKKNTLRLHKPLGFFSQCGEILKIGFGSSLLDLSTVYLTIVMNNQMKAYGGTAALSVYGILTTCTSLFQALFAGVGQGIQPLLSANYGANEKGRIKKFLSMALTTSLIMGVVFTLLCVIFPRQTVSLFTAADEEMLVLSDTLVRYYSVMFFFLGMNVVAVYYLPSVMRGGLSMIVSLFRGFVLPALTVYCLPLAFGMQGLSLALPVSEAVTALYSLFTMLSVQKNLYTGHEKTLLRGI